MHYRISADSIIAANLNLDLNHLRPGDSIQIPQSQGPTR